MANELTCTVSLAFAKGDVASIARALSAFNVDVAGARYHAGVQNVGTSEEAISKGDIGDLGWAFFRNLDATNYVEIRAASGATDLIRIPAGKACVLPLAPAATPYGIANGSAVNLEMLLVEA